jgi:GAF domain-containing protein
VISDISLPIGFGIAGTVAETGEIIDTYNPNYDKRFDEKYEAILKYDTKDIYCMPISNPGGAIVGVLQLLNRARPFTQEDHDFLGEVAKHLGAVLTAS